MYTDVMVVGTRRTFKEITMGCVGRDNSLVIGQKVTYKITHDVPCIRCEKTFVKNGTSIPATYDGHGISDSTGEYCDKFIVDNRGKFVCSNCNLRGDVIWVPCTSDLATGFFFSASESLNKPVEAVGREV